MQACPVPSEQPAVVEHPQLPQQAWAFLQEQQQQEQEQQQWREQQQQYMQLQLPLQQRQLLPQLHICKDHAVSSQAVGVQHGSREAASSVPSSGVQLMEWLSGDNEAKCCALDSIRGSVVHHTFDKQGCRAVQLAFQVADTRVAAELLSELRGRVEAATRSPHANYVIQKAIAVMPPAACSFIAQEMRGVGAAVARHRFGCRILSRLLEHMADSPACVELMAEVLAEAGQLCRDEFGHYVMQSVLEHGQPQQRARLVQALISEGPSLASDPVAYHVVETALVHGSSEEQQLIGAALLMLGSYSMVTLALTQYGSFVARALLRSRVDAALAAAEQFCHAEARLQRNRFGRRVLEQASQQALRVV